MLYDNVRFSMQLEHFQQQNKNKYCLLWTQFSLFKVIWKANIVEFFIKYFPLICHLILTKINCITLQIRSKADSKSKSQNIWQQIILFSRTIMQMICAWPKIWTLSGRLSLMRTVQLMTKMSDASKNIFRVYHIRIIAPKNKKCVHHKICPSI